MIKNDRATTLNNQIWQGFPMKLGHWGQNKNVHYHHSVIFIIVPDISIRDVKPEKVIKHKWCREEDIKLSF